MNTKTQELGPSWEDFRGAWLKFGLGESLCQWYIFKIIAFKEVALITEILKQISINKVELLANLYLTSVSQ